MKMPPRLNLDPVKCLNEGFVRLVDFMGDDDAVVQAARVSYGKGTKTPVEDAGLINYLMRNRHTSPFEMVEIKLHMKLPIFVARQMIRHRTANVNEYSGRYSEMKDSFFIPDLATVKAQSKGNKQGRGIEVPEAFARGFIGHTQGTAQDQYGAYKAFLKPEDGPNPAKHPGISREMARINLPLTVYTEWYWKIDLHNLLHFLGLRCDHHAQYEIRAYADAILELITPIVPVTIAAWKEHVQGAKTIPASLWKEIEGYIREKDRIESVGTEPAEILKSLKKIGLVE